MVLIKRWCTPADPPKRLESGPITVFGLKLGAEGKLNVTVRSNPPPTAVWMVGDIRITAPHSTDNGAITALEPLHLVRIVLLVKVSQVFLLVLSGQILDRYNVLPRPE